MSISSEVLVESRTMRSQYTDRFDVLDKVGSLSLLPDDTHATAEMVASFYEVGVEAVKSLVKDHREELENNGYRVLRGQDYKDFVRSFEDPANLSHHRCGNSRVTSCHSRTGGLLPSSIARRSSTWGCS
jgi:hypothetical protein